MNVEEASGRVVFLRSLSPPERTRLLPLARVYSVGAKELCWAEGWQADAFAFVVRGRLKLIKTNAQGRTSILHMAMPGRLACGNAVFCATPYCCTAVAMEGDAEVLTLPRREVLEIVERNPTAGQALLRELGERGMELCQRVDELAGGKVEGKIAALLLRLAIDSDARQVNGQLKVPVRLSRQDLADLCGTTIETAIRVMSRWQKAGIVQTTSQGFAIADRMALERIEQS